MQNKKKPDEIDAHIARRLASRRRALGLSQEKLGAYLDISFQQIQKYENGNNRIGASRLYHASKCLNVPTGYFFEGFEEEAASGFAEAEDQAPFSVPRGDEEEELVRHFAAIPNASTRRALIDLVRSMAEKEALPVSRK